MSGPVFHGMAQGDGGVNVGDIANSLRFRSSASAYLSRTITTDTTSTYFAAVKRGRLGAVSPIFETSVRFNANDTLTAFGLTTTAVFRDPTSWLFIHVSNGGLYVNGVSYGAVTTSSLVNPRIGFDGANYFDGYIARCGVVGGSSSSYTNFGYFNSQINEWVSKSQSAVKAVVDAGGTNSFMLDFDNATSLATLGYDKSSKGNNWTCNNFSLTAGVTYDHMLDVPGNSYATLNPLAVQSGTVGTSNQPTYANANLKATSSANNNGSHGSIGFTSGKWYWEVNVDAGSTANLTNIIGISYNGSATLYDNGIGYEGDGGKQVNGVNSAYGSSFTTNDIISVAVNADTNQIEFFKGNVSQGAISFTPTITIVPSMWMAGGTGVTYSFNFGQRPFSYIPPTGFLALCQANIETSTVTVSGTFTGNASADGPFVWMNGVPKTLTINGNAVTFGTHADKTAGGFKVRTSSASYNTAGANTWTATIDSDLENCFKYRNAQGNP